MTDTLDQIVRDAIAVYLDSAPDPATAAQPHRSLVAPTRLDRV